MQSQNTLFAQLAHVVDMARAHVDDIKSGLAEGIYSPEENADFPAKEANLSAVEALLAVIRSSSGTGVHENSFLASADPTNDEPEMRGPYRTADDLFLAISAIRVESDFSGVITLVTVFDGRSSVRTGSH